MVLFNILGLLIRFTRNKVILVPKLSLSEGNGGPYSFSTVPNMLSIIPILAIRRIRLMLKHNLTSSNQLGNLYPC